MNWKKIFNKEKSLSVDDEWKDEEWDKYYQEASIELGLTTQKELDTKIYSSINLREYNARERLINYLEKKYPGIAVKLIRDINTFSMIIMWSIDNKKYRRFQLSDQEIINPTLPLVALDELIRYYYNESRGKKYNNTNINFTY